MVRLKMVELEERAEEAARRKAEAPEEVRPNDDALTFLRPPPRRSLFPDDVVHSNTSTSLIHHTG